MMPMMPNWHCQLAIGNWQLAIGIGNWQLAIGIANAANDGDDHQMISLFMAMLRWHLVVRGKVFGNKGKIPLEAIHGYYPEDLMVSCQIDKGKILLGATHIVSCRRLNGILPET